MTDPTQEQLAARATVAARAMAKSAEDAALARRQRRPKKNVGDAQVCCRLTGDMLTRIDALVPAYEKKVRALLPAQMVCRSDIIRIALERGLVEVEKELT